VTELNHVNIEDGTVNIAVFNQTEAALAELTHKYDVIPDTSTDEGYKFVKSACKDLVGRRTAVEAERKKIKQPYLDAGRIIDAEAKRITGKLVELETPLSDAKKRHDDEEKRIKAERIARLQLKVDAIRNTVKRAKGKTSPEVAVLIEEVDAIDTANDFYDLTHEATVARSEVLDELGTIYGERMEYERAERQRKEAEEARREAERKAAIEARINKVRMIPLEFMGKSSAEINQRLDGLRLGAIRPDDFGERCEEMISAQKQAIAQLEAMAAQAELAENQALEIAKIEAERVENKNEAGIQSVRTVTAKVNISALYDKLEQCAKEQTEADPHYESGIIKQFMLPEVPTLDMLKCMSGKKNAISDCRLRYKLLIEVVKGSAFEEACEVMGVEL
jgi:anion-transporting  ArsA/GET3 family ATPase